ncbi:MAG: O-antigen ligase family protein [Trueperaceae bacterium]|nr:O-antigen ligase family protein [Trueperaceae bacterium]
MIDRRGVAWLAGGLMTVAPATTSIVAIVLTAAAAFGRWNARRSRGRDARGAARPRSSGATDAASVRIGGLLIASGAFVLSVPVAIAHGSLAAVPMGIQAMTMLAIMLVTRAWWRSGRADRRAIADGIAVGLGLLAIASLADAAGWLPIAVVEGLGWTSFAARASLWYVHPNVLATAAVLPTLAAVTWGHRAARLAAGMAALVLVTATGSRTVLAVLILLGVGTVARRAFRRTKGARVTLRLVGMIAAGSVVTVLLVTFTTVFDRFDPRLVLAPPVPSANLLYASEDLRAGSWTRLGVSLQKTGPMPGFRGDSVWAIEKSETAWWSRVQQGVTLAPGATVTFQVDLRQPDPTARPGIHARRDGPDGPVEVTVQRRESGWSVEAVRGVELVGWHFADDGDWTSLAVTVSNPSGVPLPFALGLTPDQRAATSGSTMWVRRPQAVFGEPVDYQPTQASAIHARTSLGTWSDRATWARLGWEGFAERPWFGQGLDAFADYVATRASSRSTASQEAAGSADHAHQLWSQTAFERGTVGLVGLLMLLAGFTVVSYRGQPAGWWMLALVVLLNLVDDTLWTTPVSYTLGAIAGLAGHRPRSPAAPTDAGARRRPSP